MLSWTEIIYDPDNIIIKELSSDRNDQGKALTEKIAEYFYKDIQRTKHLFTSPYTFKKIFNKLTDAEKSDWYDLASKIPEKLSSLNLYIRKYGEFCRTCLIPYNDLQKMAQADYEWFISKNNHNKRITQTEKASENDLTPFQDLPDKERRFFIEMNHLIPVELKRLGYEVIRPEEITEINDQMVARLARAIHSRYQNEMRKQNGAAEKKIYISWMLSHGDKQTADFDMLPEEIKHSNLDNAFHIPTKLLSIGYKIRPVEKGFKSATLHLTAEEIETMAKVEHIRWCWDKILHGWFYGHIKDSKKKIHPSIIPYEELSEPEKEKDRELVRMIPALLKDIDYEAYPVNPVRLKKLSYAIRPHGSIERILHEIRELNTQIKSMIDLPPAVDEIIGLRNRKIEDAIREVEGSYNIARRIQGTYLPDDLFIRECLPDSFVMFKPKDIVSGDFYFFSRQGNMIIFAAADCTGHGIPGALLSTLGYGILDQAVNEIKLTDPYSILKHMYTKIHRFLGHDISGRGLSDDMDIALCMLDIRTNVLTYAGVMNPLYRISKGELIEYKAGNLREHFGESGRNHFISEKIQLNFNDTLYLFTDGFIDQFGGKYRKKYQSSRFKSFLMSIQDYSMPEQSDRLNEEIEAWREEYREDQTDDVLVIGVRI